MRSIGIFAAFLVLPVVLEAGLPDLGPDAYYVPHKFIVNFHPGSIPQGINTQHGIAITNHPDVDRLNKTFGVYQIEELFRGSSSDPNGVSLAGYYVFFFRGTDQRRLETVIDSYSALPPVEHVEPVSVHPVQFIPNDPSFISQWYHNQPSDHDIDSPEAWDVQRGDTLPIIGIADTGVLWNHPDLANNLWKNWPECHGLPNVDDDGNGYIDDSLAWDWVDVPSGWPGEDYTTPDNNPSDFNGHGTHLAGITAALMNNGQGGAGIAGGAYPSRGARIMPLRIGWSDNRYGFEVGRVEMSYAAQALYYAAQKGVTVMNCSWQSLNTGGLSEAVSYAANSGMLICTAAGNDSDVVAVASLIAYQLYLCGRPDVIAVAATDGNDVKAGSSNCGTWVDVSAPGVSIFNTYSNHYLTSYALLSGTSMATAMVSGVAALLKTAHPSWNRVQLTSQIQNSAENIDAMNPAYVGLLGSGRINAHRALIIGTTPQISVNYPNGGQYWVIGNTYTITWSSLFLQDDVNVLLNRNYPTGTWEKLFENIPNDGAQSWMVMGYTSVASRIRVEASADTHVSDISNANFHIGNGSGGALTLFSEGFDNGFNTAQYVRGDYNPINGYDYWDVRMEQAHTGPKSLYCAGFGDPVHPPYDDGMDSYFYLKPTCCIPLSGYTDVTFSFWIRYNTELDSDMVRVQYYHNASWVNFPNSGWSGSSGGWVPKVYNLTGFSNFRFRFQFLSDNDSLAEGVYLDDIQVIGIPSISKSGIITPAVVDLSPPDPLIVNQITQSESSLSSIRSFNQEPSYCLLPVHPNPFNHYATISYQLAAAGSVSMSLYDVRGRRVADLYEGWQEAGKHEVGFDGSRLSTGVYMIRLNIGTFTAAKKMVLMK